MCVLFTSLRPLDRAENIKAVYDAYDGEKQFVQRKRWEQIEDLHSGKYRLLVADELPGDTPGKCLFIGHGMGAIKTYGLDMPRPFFEHPEYVTYAIASSRDMIPIVANQIGISESQVIPLGMPRTDAYFGEVTYEDHLYAPTFRPGGWMPDLNLMWRLMPNGMKLTVKLHPVTGNKVTSVWQNIEVASAWEISTPYLQRAKTVITDYSSIMFDAMVLRKPVILFAQDREEYLAERGIYYKYPDCYSQRYCEREEHLIGFMQTAVWTDFDEERREFFTGACDGHSVERTIELIRSML